MRNLFAAAALLAAFGAAAQTTPRPDCRAPEHHQFDFWIGSWSVADTKHDVVGESRIESIQDGCAIRETWTGGKGGTGTSLNFWDRDARRWHQTWISNDGGPLYLDGGFRDGKMVLEGERPAKGGGRTSDRITWEPIAGGRVRQVWATSSDGGKTWTTQFDGTYTAKKS